MLDMAVPRVCCKSSVFPYFSCGVRANTYIISNSILEYSWQTAKLLGNMRGYCTEFTLIDEIVVTFKSQIANTTTQSLQTFRPDWLRLTNSYRMSDYGLCPGLLQRQLVSRRSLTLLCCAILCRRIQLPYLAASASLATANIQLLLSTWLLGGWAF